MASGVGARGLSAVIACTAASDSRLIASRTARRLQAELLDICRRHDQRHIPHLQGQQKLAVLSSMRGARGCRATQQPCQGWQALMCAEGMLQLVCKGFGQHLWQMVIC